MKALPSTYRFTHNQSGKTFRPFRLAQYGIGDILLDLDRASEGWDLLFQYHGRPSGIYAADEYLAGLGAIRG